MELLSFHSILSQNCQVGAVIPILQMRTLRFRIMKETPKVTQLEAVKVIFPGSS